MTVDFQFVEYELCTLKSPRHSLDHLVVTAYAMTVGGAKPSSIFRRRCSGG